MKFQHLLSLLMTLRPIWDKTDPNKFVLWSEVAPLYPNVVTYAAGTDTSNNLTAIEKW